MEFTTRFGLHSQATRLSESASSAARDTSHGTVTLCGVPFQATLVPHVHLDKPTHRNEPEDASTDYNSPTRKATEISGLSWIPLHSPLLGESLLVSFPPLINMLKFSG